MWVDPIYNTIMSEDTPELGTDSAILGLMSFGETEPQTTYTAVMGTDDSTFGFMIMGIGPEEEDDFTSILGIEEARPANLLFGEVEDVSIYDEVTDGGVVCGGGSFIYNEIGYGGVVVAGNATTAKVFANINASGGARVGSSATFNWFVYRTATGGAIVGGTSPALHGIVPEGGAVTVDEALNKLPMDLSYTQGLQVPDSMIEMAIKLVVSIAFLAKDDSPIIVPHLLKRDVEFLRSNVGTDFIKQKHDQAAKERGARGWVVGSDQMFDHGHIGPAPEQEEHSITGRELQFAHIVSGYWKLCRYGPKMESGRVRWIMPHVRGWGKPFKHEEE